MKCEHCGEEYAAPIYEKEVSVQRGPHVFSPSSTSFLSVETGRMIPTCPHCRTPVDYEASYAGNDSFVGPKSLSNSFITQGGSEGKEPAQKPDGASMRLKDAINVCLSSSPHPMRRISGRLRYEKREGDEYKMLLLESEVSSFGETEKATKTLEDLLSQYSGDFIIISIYLRVGAVSIE